MDFGALVRPELAGEGGASNLAFNERVKALQAAGHAIAHFAFGQSPFPVPEPFTRHLQVAQGQRRRNEGGHLAPGDGGL